jgi:outer membrane protein assembly factor BamB
MISKNKPLNHMPLLYKISKRIVIIAAIFSIVLSLLMVANFFQTKTIDPLNSNALNQLMLQLQENPNDQLLKDQIRELDLLARRAYFTNRWQIRTGSFLLFGSVLVLLIAIKYMSSLRMQLPDFSESPGPEESWETRLLARKYIIGGGLALFIIAFFLGILSESELNTSKNKISGNFPTLDELRNNWPSFRGPGGNGVAYSKNVPTYWNGETGENIQWKVSVPLTGFNSPIVWKDKLFVSGADKTNQVVYCYQTETGELLWSAQLNDIPGSPTEPPDVTDDTGFAASTMTTDGNRVFVIFAKGDLAALDFEGNRIWAKSLGQPDNHYGHSSSLMVYKDLLLVQFDHNESKHLISFRTDNGEQIYSTNRADIQISWASPILINTGKREEIILSSNPFVISYDPPTGEELWRVECMDGEVAPSPVYADGMVFVVNEYARLAAIKLDSPPQLAWEFEDNLSEVSSPVASKDLVMMAASYGTVTCLDAKSGEEYWVQDFDDGFYSSPILVGDLVYVIDLEGVTHIFKASKEYEFINSAPLFESVVTVPAFMDNSVYIRGTENLYCIRK